MDELKPLADDDEIANTDMQRLASGIGTVIEGQKPAIRQILVALLAGGHVLVEGVPGVAKTLLARCLASSLRLTFSRIQFTPDLMPADITGVNVFEAQTGQFRFRPGPLFGDIVLADEINRAPAKTQSALLEAMQERQVTVDGETRPLSEMFFVMATQNPLEYHGTYPLPEAQLDRFFMKIWVQYPEEQEEKAVLQKAHELGGEWEHPERTIQPLIEPERLLELRRQAQSATVDDTIFDYVLRIVRGSRTLPTLSLGASPRAGIMLMEGAKALAVVEGRDYVIPDDVRFLCKPVFRHRLRLTPEAELEGEEPDTVIESLLGEIEVPR